MIKTNLKIKLSWGFLLRILAAFSFVGLFSTFYWLFDLFNHFRVHALLASVLLLAITITLSRKNIVLALLIFAVNAALFFIPIYQSSGISNISNSEGGQQIKIVSANVYMANTQYQKAINVITRDAPDVIALIETDENWINYFNTTEKEYKYSVKHPSNNCFGMAIYSKLPFQSKIIDVGNYHLPLAILEFDHFRLIVAHPFPPISRQDMQENKLYLEAVAKHAINTDKPVVVAGDLNSTLWGDTVKPLLASGFKRINLIGIAYTWPTYFPLFMMQIDHFFARDIKEANFTVLSDIGSDHYPIQTVIKLPLIR